jgi:hypothetical protein
MHTNVSKSKNRISQFEGKMSLRGHLGHLSEGHHSFSRGLHPQTAAIVRTMGDWERLITS